MKKLTVVIEPVAEPINQADCGHDLPHDTSGCLFVMDDGSFCDCVSVQTESEEA